MRCGKLTFGPVVALAATGLWIAPLAARADGTQRRDPVAGQALFDEGRRLVSEGHLQQGCAKLEESQRADPGLGTQFHLADCWQRLGRRASAWSLFREVAREAHDMRQPAREHVARDRAEALEPWLAHLVVAPHGIESTRGLSIARDGIDVDRATWALPIPVDPGPHEITAQAPGKQAWALQVDVGDSKTVTVDVPALVDLPSPLPPALATSTVDETRAAPAGGRRAHDSRGVTEAMPESGLSTTYESPVAMEHPTHAQRAVGWTLAGIGIAGMAAGGYLGGLWLDDRDRADGRCHPTCNATGAQLRSDSKTFGIAAAATGGAGVGALIVGIALVASAPSDRPSLDTAADDGADAARVARGTPPPRESATVRLSPLLGPGQAGAVVLGTW